MLVLVSALFLAGQPLSAGVLVSFRCTLGLVFSFVHALLVVVILLRILMKRMELCQEQFHKKLELLMEGVLPQVSKRKGMLEIVDKLVPGLVLPWVDSMNQPSQLNLHPATLCFEDKELEEKYRKHEDEIPATFKEQKGWSPSRRAFRLMFTVTALFNLALC